MVNMVEVASMGKENKAWDGLIRRQDDYKKYHYHTEKESEVMMEYLQKLDQEWKKITDALDVEQEALKEEQRKDKHSVERMRLQGDILRLGREKLRLLEGIAKDLRSQMKGEQD